MHVELELQHIQRWIDKKGRHRSRVRRRINGKHKVLGELPVNGDPSSPEYQAAYHAILRGVRPADAIAGVAARGGSGSVKNGIEQYLNSATFRELSPSTQSLRRSILNGVSRTVGNLPLAMINRKWIDSWMESASTKGVGRTRFLALRPFLQWACETVHLIEANFTDSMKVKAKQGDGHATWTDEEIAQFCAHHPIGSMARLAIELMLAVAGRRGDAIALGRQHLKQDEKGEWWLVFTQEKNRKRNPVTVGCPVTAELAAAIEACPGPETSLTFLANGWGRPFTKRGFNDWFREQTEAAGLGEHCVPHGLRKAKCRIMAENDCTVHEIKSHSGHRSIKEVERYTSAVDNRKLAARAAAKVAAANNVVPLREVAG